MTGETPVPLGTVVGGTTRSPLRSRVNDTDLLQSEAQHCCAEDSEQWHHQK